MTSPMRRTSKQSVVRLGLGEHLHAAAEITAVRDHRVDHPASTRLAVDRDPHLARLPAGEHGERRPVVGDLAAERLRGLVRTLRDRAADPGARDVREVCVALVAGPRAKGHAPDDRSRARFLCARPAARGRGRAGWRTSARSPSRFRAGGSASSQPVAPATPFTTSCTEPSPPTTTSSVAPSIDRLACELGQLAGPLGEERVPGQPEGGGAMCDLRPAATGRPTGRGRVDEEDGAGANGRGRPWRCRARSSSCGRPPSGDPRPRSARTRPRRRCR